MMILFPQTLVAALIVGSLLLTGAGAITLLVLLWKDRHGKNIW